MTTAPDKAGTMKGANGRVRVIVVGRTALAGIDAVLRKDRSVELIRARSAVAAVGEAANPLDEDSPNALTVVVSPEALEPSRSAAFARAMRRIHPAARLVGLGAQVSEGFDGVLGAGLSPEALGAAVRQGIKKEPAAAPEPPPPAPEPIAPPRAATDGTDPASALATGQDPVAAALQSLKARWNLVSARVEAPTAGGVAVEFGGRRVGSLVTEPPLPPGAGEREALTLAPWVVLARQQEQLRHAAFSDELTGAWNRRYFNRFLTAAIASATEKRHTVTLLVFDVDNFKSYNDRFGHGAGDEILVEMVRLLNAGIRPTDRVCRVGGDEFAVVFHDPAGPRSGVGGPTSPQSISEIVRRFQRAICEHRFPKLSEMAPGTLTISGGMATFPWDGRTVAQLHERADELAMQSKREGKNKVALGPGAEQVCGG